MELFVVEVATHILLWLKYKRVVRTVFFSRISVFWTFRFAAQMLVFLSLPLFGFYMFVNFGLRLFGFRPFNKY